MTYVGPDGTDSPPVIIYQRRLWFSDEAGHQIGDRLIAGSRSKSSPSRVELFVFQRIGANLKRFIKILFPGN